jgi:hypothetical protein
MRPTTPGILLLLVLLAALAAPVAAVGQATGPEALWNAYPLDQATTTPARATGTPPAVATPAPATSPAAAPEPSDSGGIPIWAIIAGALALIVLGGGVAIFTLARLRERRRPPAAADSTHVPEAPVAPEPDPAPARAAEPVARPAPPEPAPAAPAPTVAAAAPATTGATTAQAGGVVTADDLELAELAAEYLWTVATGSRRPVVDLAARRFLRVGRAREMLSRARARGILTGAGRGRPGGALTEKGRRILEAGSRSTGAPTWQEGAVPPAAAPGEAAPAPPTHLRLAEGDEEGHGSLSASAAASVEGGTTGRTFTVLEGGARNLP